MLSFHHFTQQQSLPLKVLPHCPTRTSDASTDQQRARLIKARGPLIKQCEKMSTMRMVLALAAEKAKCEVHHSIFKSEVDTAKFEKLSRNVQL